MLARHYPECEVHCQEHVELKKDVHRRFGACLRAFVGLMGTAVADLARLIDGC